MHVVMSIFSRDSRPTTGNSILRRRFWPGAIDFLREARWITRERLMLYGGVFAAVSVLLLAKGVPFYTAHGLTSGAGMPLTTDFMNFYVGAKAAAAGHASLVYNDQWFHALEHRVIGPGRFVGAYVYPPLLLLLSLPLALFSVVPALIVWTALGAGLCFALLWRLVGWQAAALAVVGAPAAFWNLLAGQTGNFTAAFLAGGLMLLERHPTIAGICFGCLAYKPHLGLLLPFALGAGRQWRAFAAAAATVVVLVLASLALFGAAAWAGFLGQMANQRHLVETAGGLARLPTVFAAARELGASPMLAYAAQTVSGGAALALIVAVWRRPCSVEAKSAALAVAIFLATPYALDYDEMIVVFAAAWLAREGVRSGFRPWERLMIVLLLVSPLATFVSSVIAGVPLGPVIFWLAFAVIVRRARGTVAALSMPAEA
jgi:arabinofuranan 3-O-arabinosyltransferase